MKIPAMALMIAAYCAVSGNALAREYFVGGPVHQHDMEIVANYLVGIEMAPMRPDMVDPTQKRAMEPSAPPAAMRRYFCKALLLFKKDCREGSRREMSPQQDFPVRSHHLSNADSG